MSNGAANTNAHAPLMPRTLLLDDGNIPALMDFVADIHADAATELKTELPSTAQPAAKASNGTKRSTRVAMSPETLRRRRLDREKLRMRGVKDLLEQLRRDVVTLETMRVEATRQRMEHPENALHLQRFLSVVHHGDQLQRLHEHQDDALLQHQAQTMALMLLAAQGNQFCIATDTNEELTRSPAVVPDPDGIRMDPVILLASILRQERLSPREAEAFVADSCREMAQTLAQPDWTSGPEEFGGGLSGGRCVHGTLLEFRLAKRLANITPRALVDKTWALLTQLDEYRRIQPHTRQLRVLQRVTESSWVVAFAVGACHSLVLVSRTAVADGFVVTFRSLPLVRKHSNASESARRQFVESETGSIYSSTFSWYNFQPRANASGDGIDCDVIFGGTARSPRPDYLNQLQLEVVAGFARWQTAVGFPHVLFLAPLVST